MKNLELLVLKKSHIEPILEFLSLLSGRNDEECRSTTFLPFATTENEKLNTAGTGSSKGKNQENLDTEGTTNSRERSSEPAEGEREKCSLISMAKKEVNDEFLAFDWLQELGSRSSFRTVQNTLETLSLLICNQAFASKPD